MIQAVFFDFGGVIAAIDHQKMRALEDRYGLPQGGLWQAMYGTPEWHALRVGSGSEQAWVEAIRRTVDELAGRHVSGDIQHEWVKCWRGLDHDVVALAQRLRGRYRVGMISNATLKLERELRDVHRIHHVFDIIVNSARVGMAKPDAGIFRLAAERAGVEPARCLHVDDLLQNVRGAEEAGFRAVHYDGHYPALERSLRSFGVEW